MENQPIELISTYKPSDFKQSQSHGLFWDSEIREIVFLIKACKNDTKKYDISCDENRFDTCENISIKTTGGNNIDCGDILRFYDGDFTKKYTIILIIYKQKTNSKQINEIIEINYTEELRNILFGTISRDILEKFATYIKSIPSGNVEKKTKQNYIILKNQLQQKFNMKINISPKVDSKSQRRVQCSIPKIQELFTLYPQFIISRTYNSKIRGVNITNEIPSEKRVRNKIIKPYNSELNLDISSCLDIDLGPTVLLNS